MALFIKKYGDPHIYTVLSYDDHHDDPYYCVVKWDPTNPDTRPTNVMLSTHNWKRIDRIEVEYFSGSTLAIAEVSHEVDELYYGGESGLDKNPTQPHACSVRENLKPVFTTEALRILLGILNDIRRGFIFPYPYSTDETHEPLTATKYMEIISELKRTDLLQPHQILEYIGSVEVLLKEMETEVAQQEPLYWEDVLPKLRDGQRVRCLDWNNQDTFVKRVPSAVVGVDINGVTEMYTSKAYMMLIDPVAKTEEVWVPTTADMESSQWVVL